MFKKTTKWIIAFCLVGLTFAWMPQQTFQLKARVVETNESWFDLDFEEIDFEGGYGSIEDPYQISQPHQLAYLSYLINNDVMTEEKRSYSELHYVMVNDLDISGKEWVPIGTQANPFAGVFDGNGKTITGMTFTQVQSSGANLYGVAEIVSTGLFGLVKGGTIKDLIIADALVDVDVMQPVVSDLELGEVSFETRVALIGILAVSLEENVLIDDVRIIDSNIIIRDDALPVDASIDQTIYLKVGMLAARSSGFEMGIRIADEPSTDLTIIRSSVEGDSGIDVQLENQHQSYWIYTGGFIGISQSGKTEITDSFYHGFIHTHIYKAQEVSVGGLIGSAVTTHVTNSFVRTQTLSDDGIQVHANTIDYNLNVGGLFGFLISNAQVKHSYAHTEMVVDVEVFTGSFSVYLGGLAGYAGFVDVIESFMWGTIDADFPYPQHMHSRVYVGGLTGLVHDSRIIDSFAMIDITANIKEFDEQEQTKAFVGGVAGLTDYGVSLENVFAVGEFAGNTNMGGVIGKASAINELTLQDVFWVNNNQDITNGVYSHLVAWNTYAYDDLLGHIRITPQQLKNVEDIDGEDTLFETYSNWSFGTLKQEDTIWTFDYPYAMFPLQQAFFKMIDFTFNVPNISKASQYTILGSPYSLPTLDEVENKQIIGWVKQIEEGVYAKADFSRLLFHDVTVKGMYRDVVLSTNSDLLQVEANIPAHLITFDLDELSEDVSVKLVVDILKESEVSQQDKETLQTFVLTLEGEPVFFYLDISLFKVVGDTQTMIHELDETIKIFMIVPEAFQTKDFTLLRVHQGVVESIDVEYDPETGLMSFETDKFSTYALVYMESSTHIDDEQQLPDTGQTDNRWPWIMLILGAGFVLLGKKRKVSNL